MSGYNLEKTPDLKALRVKMGVRNAFFRALQIAEHYTGNIKNKAETYIDMVRATNLIETAMLAAKNSKAFGDILYMGIALKKLQDVDPYTIAGKLAEVLIYALTGNPHLTQQTVPITTSRK